MRKKSLYELGVEYEKAAQIVKERIAEKRKQLSALKDPVWGDESPVQFTDIPCHAVWAEAVAGVRAEIAKNFYMGWSLRYKYPIYKGPIANGGPWYVPGLGSSTKAAFGATYTITYYLNFNKRRP